MVTVTSGANEATADLDGQRIDQVRTAFTTALNIPEGAQATVNGNPETDEFILENGDQLSFVKDTAAKGA